MPFHQFSARIMALLTSLLSKYTKGMKTKSNAECISTTHMFGLLLCIKVMQVAIMTPLKNSSSHVTIVIFKLIRCYSGFHFGEVHLPEEVHLREQDPRTENI